MKNVNSNIEEFKDLTKISIRLLDDLSVNDCILLYAFNKTGKTRLSMSFKDYVKKKENGAGVLYFNAFTEDLFVWNNDLDKDKKRFIKINEQSNFINGLKGLSIEEKIRKYLRRYAKFDFNVNYDDWTIAFNKVVPNPKYHSENPHNTELEYITEDNIKISRGEENVFVVSLFFAICELAIEGHENYQWVKYIYVDDPISSLDENNAIAVATDLALLIKDDIKNNKETAKNKKFIISSHHGLFYNVMYNELRNKEKCYFMHKTNKEIYRLQSTDDTPFFHHIEQLCELKQAVSMFKSAELIDNKIVQSNILKTYHFNVLRTIFEKTSIFFGHDNFSWCLEGLEDEELYSRAVNIMSHGRYSLFSPVGMLRENAELFVKIFESFVNKYMFELPDVFFE